MKAKEFLEKARAIHGKAYVYALPESVTWKRKVTITCRKHGAFEQNAANHISGKKGCSECGRERTAASRQLDTPAFVIKAKAVHGDLYNYSKTKYKSSDGQITIVCSIHGAFKQTANNHLNGKGCFDCAHTESGKSKRKDWSSAKSLRELLSTDFIFLDTRSEFAQSDYVSVKCPTHGKVNSSVRGFGLGVFCHKCDVHNKRKSMHDKTLAARQLEFIATAKSLFGDLYGFEKVEYVRATKAVTLVCQIHGDFKISPNTATSRYSTGKHKESICPTCNRASKKVTVDNYEFVCRGYEGLALEFLKAKGIRMRDVRMGKDVPVVPISFKKNNGHVMRKHLPDIYLPKQNMLVEVKSTGTFGLTKFHTDGTELIKCIQHKSLEAKKAGYRYAVILFKETGGKKVRTKLPADWDTMKVKELREWWEASCRECV